MRRGKGDSRRRGRLAGALAICLCLALLAPAAALAHNHLVKIREVFAGSSGAPGDEYVELQMYASGQNFFENEVSVDFYDASGTMTYSFAPTTLDGNPPHGENQARVLFATQSAQTDFSKPAGYTLSAGNHIADAGGAACYLSGSPSFKDCVSWGSFSGSLPSSTGGNVDPSGIPDGQAIRRSIVRGCSTLLEAGDDTGKPANWKDVTPAPLNNADTPPEHRCPETTITKGPKRKTTDRTPTFRFKSSQPNSTFECRIDSKPFKDCDSPFTTKRLRRGKHRFKVKATHKGSTDPTPAKRAFKVVRRHH